MYVNKHSYIVKMKWLLQYIWTNNLIVLIFETIFYLIDKAWPDVYIYIHEFIRIHLLIYGVLMLM